MQLQHWLIQFGTQHAYLIYVVILIVAIAEGPILSVLLGILLRLGYFSVIPVYIALMAGDLIGDVGLYYLGYHYGKSVVKKFKKIFNFSEEKIEKVETLFHAHHYKILFISKLTNGFGLAMAVLTTAGIVRINFWKYMRSNISGQLLWSGMLLSLGYFFSTAYVQIHSWIGRAALIGAVALGIFFTIQYIKKMRNSF
jgi:membrane protein DedA with SNARE-associated domain